jgi:predicted secreted protein
MSMVSPSPLSDRAAGIPDGDTKRLVASCGTTFRITLWEDRTRGELWVPSYDSAALLLTDDDFTRIATGNAADVGRRTFEFLPVAEGTHRIVFEKRLGWKFTAEDRRVYLVEVGDSSEPASIPGQRPLAGVRPPEGAPDA